MTTDVETVASDDSVREALGAMVRRDIGSVVVVDDGETIGIFTERDVTRRVLTDSGLLDESVREVMSSPPITIRPQDSIDDALALMNRAGVRRLPVLDGRRLVGIVTEGDLRRWVARVARE